MLLRRLSTTVSLPSGFKLLPSPAVTPAARYLAAGLPTGALTGWSNQEATATLAPAAGGAPTVADVDGVRAVVTNGTTDRFSTANGPAWRTAAIILKLPTTTTGEDQLLGPNLASNGMLYYNSATGLLGWRNGTAATITVPASPGWTVVMITVDAAGNGTLSVRKTRAGAVIGTEAPPAGLRVAGNFSSGNHLAASIAEIDLWTTVLTASQSNDFDDYASDAYPTVL